MQCQGPSREGDDIDRQESVVLRAGATTFNTRDSRRHVGRHWHIATLRTGALRVRASSATGSSCRPPQLRRNSSAWRPIERTPRYLMRCRGVSSSDGGRLIRARQSRCPIACSARSSRSVRQQSGLRRQDKKTDCGIGTRIQIRICETEQSRFRTPSELPAPGACTRRSVQPALQPVPSWRGMCRRPVDATKRAALRQAPSFVYPA